MRALTAAATAALLLLAPAAPTVAKSKKGSTAPGTYSAWGDETIDELEIVSSFKLASFERIVVEPFDTSEIELPDRDDNTYEPVKEVLKNPAKPFVAGLRRELEEPSAEVGERSAEAGAGALVVRAKLTTLDPGSRAARYWGGFGAGSARVEIRAEILDGATGKALLRFTHERRSGVGAFGGDYVDLLERSLRELGEDCAVLLSAF